MKALFTKSLNKKFSIVKKYIKPRNNQEYYDHKIITGYKERVNIILLFYFCSKKQIDPRLLKVYFLLFQNIQMSRLKMIIKTRQNTILSII